jgi:mannose-6-phosphate isomerase-like protein (cupin superfamily)
MQHITNPDDEELISYNPMGAKGFNFVFEILSKEYTDAYSIDLVSVDVGGFSPFHIDPDNHAFYILEGEAEMVIAEERSIVRKGEIARIPMGVVHSITNHGNVPLKMLSFYDPPRDRSLQIAAAKAQADVSAISHG